MKKFYLSFLVIVALVLPRVSEAQEQTVWEIIQTNPNTLALSVLLQGSELIEVLDGPGPITVLAPSTTSIAAIPPEQIAVIQADTTGATQALLLYHVLGGAVQSTALTDGLMAETLQGGSVTFGVTGDSVTVDGVPVVVADLIASNGVVHVIGGILSPPMAPAETEVQDIPLTFESDNVEYQLFAFGDAVATRIDNPDPAGNGSAKVMSLEKPTGAQTWAGVAMPIATPLDFSSSSLLYVRVWSPRAGIPYLLKIEDTNSAPDANGNPSVFAEVFASSTVANAWETLVFDMSTHPAFNVANSYNQVVFFGDMNNPGVGETFFVDNIAQEDLAITSSVNLAIENQFKVSPNPFQQQTLVTWNNPDNSTFQVSIINVTGQVVKSFSTVSGEQLIVTKDDLTSGMYFLNFRDEAGNMGTLKMMIE